MKRQKPTRATLERQVRRLKRELERAWRGQDELNQAVIDYNPGYAGYDRIESATKIIQKLSSQESDYIRTIGEVLKCDPIPACKRADKNLEPPWEVVNRIRTENNRLKALVAAHQQAETDRAMRRIREGSKA